MSEQKESKIKAILGNPREYKGEKNTTWYFTVEMENGDKGQIGKNKPDALNVGDTLRYTLEENSKGYMNLREVREGKFGGGGFRGTAAPSPASIALTVAKDLVVANITASGKPLEMNEALAAKTTAMADRFLPG